MTVDSRQWEEELQGAVSAHFDGVRARVPDVYRRHFASLSGVLRRHWQYRRDIPRDLASLPRFTWHALRGLLGKTPPEARRYSGKELAVAELVAAELLRMSELEQALLDHLANHPELEERGEELRALLAEYSPAQREARLRQAVARLGVDQEGTRDALVFLTLGLAGRAVSDKVVFGSASALGAVAASSLYIGQQSFLAGLWAKWFGVPAWVSVAGGTAGFALLLLATPLVAPFVECGVNRLRAERLLRRIVDEAQHQFEGRNVDGYTFAAYAGTYMQLLPDLVNILRQLR